MTDAKRDKAEGSKPIIHISTTTIERFMCSHCENAIGNFHALGNRRCYKCVVSSGMEGKTGVTPAIVPAWIEAAWDELVKYGEGK